MKTIEEYEVEYFKFVDMSLNELAHKLGVSENIAVIIRVHRPEHLTNADIKWLREVEKKETKYGSIQKGG